MSDEHKPAGSVAPAPEPADVGIVAALPIEVGPFLRRFNNIRKYASERHTVIEGECAGKLVVLIVSGAGRKNARRGAQLLLGGHRPHWLISAGLGGALDPSLNRNDTVFATEILGPEGPPLSIDVHMPDEELSKPGRRVRTGRLLTVDKIVRTAAEKAELRQQHTADVVDMETSAVAHLCRERGVRFLSIRTISDEAGIDLPPEVLTILGPSGGYRVRRGGRRNLATAIEPEGPLVPPRACRRCLRAAGRGSRRHAAPSALSDIWDSI